MSTNAKKTLEKFTLINNTVTGEVSTVTQVSSKFKGIDQDRLKSEYPAIFQNLVGEGIKLTVKKKINKKTGKPEVTQHPNECAQYRCCTGLKDVKHSMLDRSRMNIKGNKAQMQTLDLSFKNEDGTPGTQCENLVYVGKGDEPLHLPVCEDCRGTKETGSGTALPTDVLGDLGLTAEDLGISEE
jgi:hypothetical protein